LRLFVQPLVASLIAVRDARADARTGRGAYLWSVISDSAHRRYLLQEGWQDISKVFVLACVLDLAYQWLEWHALRPLQALLTATVLAVVPYILLRGPINRLWQVCAKRSSVR
jgi:hypothetical protein